MHFGKPWSAFSIPPNGRNKSPLFRAPHSVSSSIMPILWRCTWTEGGVTAHECTSSSNKLQGPWNDEERSCICRTDWFNGCLKNIGQNREPRNESGQTGITLNAGAGTIYQWRTAKAVFSSDGSGRQISHTAVDSYSPLPQISSVILFIYFYNKVSCYRKNVIRNFGVSFFSINVWFILTLEHDESYESSNISVPRGTEKQTKRLLQWSAFQDSSFHAAISQIPCYNWATEV